MKTGLTLAISLIAIISAIVILQTPTEKKENFDAVGLVYNKPPNWFNKQAYNPSDWIVTYYPDQISQPECMYYNRGNPRELNWLSSAYRFWRF